MTLPESSSPGVRNVALTVAYDGTGFHGFAESPGVTTVMGELRAALERVLRVELDLTAAGRTDAGVHGWGQVVSGRIPASTDLDRLQRSVNRMCAPSIAMRAAQWVPDEFDARFSATARSYRYDVWNCPQPNPLRARTSWHVVEPLAVDAMNAAAGHVVGEHDFSSFCRRPKVVSGEREASLVRVVRHAAWRCVDTEEGTADGGAGLLRFEVTASSFCHQMVRSLVGTFVDVGRGRRDAASLPATLAACDRSTAGPVAPPTGLVLWHVSYDGPRWDDDPRPPT